MTNTRINRGIQKRKRLVEQHNFWKKFKENQKLEHYKKMFTDPVYWRTYRYSVYKCTDYHGIVEIEGEIEDGLTWENVY